MILWCWCPGSQRLWFPQNFKNIFLSIKFSERKHKIAHVDQECAKVRASGAFVPYVSDVSTCFTCSRSFVPLHLMCFHFLCVLCALIFYVLYVAYETWFFTCLTWSHLFTCLHFYTCLTCPHFFTCLMWLHFFMYLKCPYFFMYLTCLYFLHALLPFTFVSVSNFWRFLRASTFFIKCGTTQNTDIFIN